MAIARSWRHPDALEGPVPVRYDDIAALNQVFSDAFSDRYRRDGMVGVRVPFLNPAVWRYAIDDANGGAMLWRDDAGQIVAFNIAHVSGAEGWMGPLAVRPEYQRTGTGKIIVRAGIDWLRRSGARVIGLETMPRTMDNIGFYSGLGFVPGHLTVTLTLDAGSADASPLLLGRIASRERDEVIEECRALLERFLPGHDFTREIQLTDQLSLGDTVLIRSGSRLAGFAVCHTVPLVEGRVREELRVLKLVVGQLRDLPRMLRALADFARRSGTRRVAIRLQGEYSQAYRRIVELRARVRWTDLRMTLEGHHSVPVAGDAVVLSNWEI